jgi:hypothetical protein
MNFQADKEGGDVVVLTGDATIDRNPPNLTRDTSKSTAKQFLR